MRNVNWTALNRALCEALTVPKKNCFFVQVENGHRIGPYTSQYDAEWSEFGDQVGHGASIVDVPEYPNIISVDALMPLLAERGWTSIRFFKDGDDFGVEAQRENPGKVLYPWARLWHTPEPRHALAIAAAAALNVKVEGDINNG